MRIGIIGAGKVGVSMAKYLSGCPEVSLSGFFSKTKKSTEEGANFVGTKAYSSLQDLVVASDTLLITTPDSVIGEVWDCIAETIEFVHEAEDSATNSFKILCHLSGSLSSEIFSKNHNFDFVHGCSLHPVYAFHDKFSSYKQLHQAFFTLEGDEVALDAMTSVLDNMGNSYEIISSKDKVKYHCAASLASNHVIGLLETSISMLKECGFTERGAYGMLAPLVKNNVAAVFSENTSGLSGTATALTGPIERKDIETVKKHFDVLSKEEKILYSILGSRLIDLSKKKHSETDFGEIEQLFHDIKNNI